jgi:hypothetical protein
LQEIDDRFQASLAGAGDEAPVHGGGAAADPENMALISPAVRMPFFSAP